MKKLVFVYNGDSGMVNGVLHYLHKRISPSTYPCNLCGVIYDGMSIKTEWHTFVQSLGVATEFLHRDEYARQYGATTVTWPAVLLHDGNRLQATVMSSDDFSNIQTLSDLQGKLRGFVSEHFGIAPLAGSLA